MRPNLTSNGAADWNNKKNTAHHSTHQSRDLPAHSGPRQTSHPVEPHDSDSGAETMSEADVGAKHRNELVGDQDAGTSGRRLALAALEDLGDGAGRIDGAATGPRLAKLDHVNPFVVDLRAVRVGRVLQVVKTPVIATIISADGTILRVVSKNICHDATLGCLQIPPPMEVYLDITLIRLSCVATLYYIELIRYQ